MTEEHSQYGRDATDVLTRWDDGEIVWTIEMGGMGPGYEQAIQVTAMEILRHLLETEPNSDEWKDKDKWAVARDQISDAVMAKIDGLGLSGAQWGAALSVGTGFYMRGPSILEEVEQDRRIMVTKNFPSIEESAA